MRCFPILNGVIFRRCSEKNIDLDVFDDVWKKPKHRINDASNDVNRPPLLSTHVFPRKKCSLNVMKSCWALSGKNWQRYMQLSATSLKRTPSKDKRSTFEGGQFHPRWIKSNLFKGAESGTPRKKVFPIWVKKWGRTIKNNLSRLLLASQDALVSGC